MNRFVDCWGVGFGLVLAFLSATACQSDTRCAPTRIRVGGGSALMRYAASELQSYARELFGADWPIEADASQPAPAGTRVIRLRSDQTLPGTAPLESDDVYELLPSGAELLVHGSNDRSVLYGVYELVRGWGVRFHLSGDELPAAPAAGCALPTQPIRRQAQLRLRGAHPYPDFLAGPSSWDEAQYDAYLRQLPKLGLNFFGIHQYAYEPYVDYQVDGVHPRSGRLETSDMAEWGYGNVAVCELEVGRELFDANSAPGCVWGSQAALAPRTPDERYARAEALMAHALGRARELGLLTAFGFEPRTADPEFAQLMTTPDGQERVTRARIDGVLSAFPGLDYVWLFTDEAGQADHDNLHRTLALIGKMDSYLASKTPAPRLMIGGWNVEPVLKDYDSGFQGVSFRPTTVFTSYGNYDPWRTAMQNLEDNFAGLAHPHSIATWCEYDGRLLAGLQPNVTAYSAMMRQMRTTGAAGFFFLHWNTRLCDANLEYLSRAAWEEGSLDSREFYRSYFAGRFALTDADAQAMAGAMLKLEDVNRGFAYPKMAFWLMADDWRPLGPWKPAADAVARLGQGQALAEADAGYLRDQLKQAQDFAPAVDEARTAAEALARLPELALADRDGAAFLANRARFFADYFSEFARLSTGLQAVLDADGVARSGRDPSLALGGLQAALDPGAWRAMVGRYAEMLDDRGEKGILISLNQKILAGIDLLQSNLTAVMTRSGRAHSGDLPQTSRRR